MENTSYRYAQLVLGDGLVDHCANALRKYFFEGDDGARVQGYCDVGAKMEELRSKFPFGEYIIEEYQVELAGIIEKDRAGLFGVHHCNALMADIFECFLGYFAKCGVIINQQDRLLV